MSFKNHPKNLLFSKRHFIVMLIGLVLILVGFLLMSGGEMKDPNVWDKDVIYSFRRITLAPFLVIAGLVLQAYAIFKK